MSTPDPTQPPVAPADPVRATLDDLRATFDELRAGLNELGYVLVDDLRAIRDANAKLVELCYAAAEKVRQREDPREARPSYVRCIQCAWYLDPAGMSDDVVRAIAADHQREHQAPELRIDVQIGSKSVHVHAPLPATADQVRDEAGYAADLMIKQVGLK